MCVKTLMAGGITKVINRYKGDIFLSLAENPSAPRTKVINNDWSLIAVFFLTVENFYSPFILQFANFPSAMFFICICRSESAYWMACLARSGDSLFHALKLSKINPR